MSKFTVAIDFDGTIVEHRYPTIGNEVPHAIYWMKRFQELGAQLILYTMRSRREEPEPDVLQEAVDYCKSRGVTFWGVNENPEQHKWTKSPKVYANVYIDDAAVGCPLLNPVEGRPYVDWTKVGPKVEDLILEHD